jgi:hypothetical protein
MQWNKYSNLDGLHAFLSASKYYWVNYDDEKLVTVWSKWQASQRGTELHEFASKAINLGIRLPKNNKTLNAYVNDAIGFKMRTEQILYYSENCFGTADAIVFRDNFLRIHDLKTGVSPASIKQLEIYSALFCLEYQHNPADIGIELRLYQLNEILVHIPAKEDIAFIIEKIVDFDKKIEKLKRGD